MAQQWQANSIIKNWQKTTATAIRLLLSYHLLCILGLGCTPPVLAQNSGMLPEISLTNGLPVLSTRKVVVDPNGTLLIATDAGLHVAPNINPAYAQMQSLLKNIQVWDLVLHDSLVYAATYNKGLFVFSAQTGKLIRLFPFTQLPRIRKLRLINNQVYVIANQGVFKIENLKPSLIFYTKSILDEHHMPIKPMDVFYRQNKLYVLTYGFDGLWEQEALNVWKNVTQQVISKITNPELMIKNYSFPSLTAQEIDGNIYFGGVNEYFVWTKDNQATCYQIQHKPEEDFAIWDWVKTNHHIYGAVGNVDNFKTGGVIIHNSQQNIVPAPSWNQAAWNLTYDPQKQKLWIATNTGGIFLQNLLFHNLPNPFKTGEKKILNQFIFTWYNDSVKFLNTANKHQQTYTTLAAPERIWDVFHHQNNYFVVGRTGIYKVNSVLSPQPQLELLENSYHSQGSLNVGNNHWFFPMYAPLILYNSASNKIKKFPFLHMADAMSANQYFGIYHSIEKGFFITRGDTVLPLKTPNNIPHYFYANFAITQNHLLLQHANSLVLFQIDSKQNQLIFLNQINIANQFRNFNIQKISSTESSFILQTSTHILEFDVVKNSKLRLKNQLYVGNYYKTKFIGIQGGNIFLDRGDEIQKISFQNKEIKPFDYVIYSNKTDFIPVKFVTKLNETQNYQIAISGNDYLYHHKFVYSLDLFNLKSENESQFFFVGDNKFWVNSLDRGRYIATLQNLNRYVSALWISVVDYYFDVPFYLLLFLLILFTMGAYFNIKQSRISVQRRIAILRLQTLRLNFNPHFIYNSMGLIQSLIVQNNTRKAVDVTARLARLNRVFLSNSTKDLIGLDEEMRFIQDYVDMEQLRFEEDNELRVNISKPAKHDLSQWLMPPLILQPLVENAIKHGLLPSKKRGVINITLEKLDIGKIKITITNPITKSRSKSQSTGLGNKLVYDRIEVFNSLYKPNYQAFFQNFVTDDNNYVAEIILYKSASPSPEMDN